MIDTRYICPNVMPVGLFYSKLLFQRHQQKPLRPEHFMTAAECLNLREYPIERPRTDGHGIGIIDNPGFRAVCLYGLRNHLIHGNCSQRTEDSAGPHGIAYGLVNAICFGRMHVGPHLIKGRGQYGNDDKVRTRKPFFQKRCRYKIPAAFRSFACKKTVSYDFIGFCRLSVDIIQPNGT